MERSRPLTQEITDRFWQAEARTQETKQLIRDIKRITRRRFTAEEKIRIVLEGGYDKAAESLCKKLITCFIPFPVLDIHYSLFLTRKYHSGPDMFVSSCGYSLAGLPRKTT